MNVSCPAGVLLASDERIFDFLGSSVCSDWDAAVRLWRAALQPQERSAVHSAPVSSCKPTHFSDEEFFSATQQLEDIAAVLAGMATSSAAHHVKKNMTEDKKTEASKTACSVLQDIFALDPAMFTDSLSPDQRLTCERASEMFERREFGAAVHEFSTVIDSCLPRILNEALLGNRAACHLCNENYKLCIRDSMRSYEKNDHYIVSIRRCVRAYICTGECVEARKIVDRYKAKCGYDFAMELSAAALYESYSAAFDAHEHASALQSINELLVQIPCASFEALKVRLLSLKEGNQAALVYVTYCLERYPDFPDLLYWRAQLCFLESDGKSELEGVLPLFNVSVPTEYVTRFRQAGNRVQQCMDLCQKLDFLHEHGEWMQLTDLCSRALRQSAASDRLRAVLLRHRARGHFETGRLCGCVDDAAAALRGGLPPGARARLLVLKATAEERLSRLADAAHSADRAVRADRTAETTGLSERLGRRLREQQRRREQKQAQQKSTHGNGEPPRGSEQHGERKKEEQKEGQRNAAVKNTRRTAQLYAHLSLPEGANQELVRKSYRDLAMRWHPDKWSGAPKKQQKEAEERFKQVKTACDEIMSIILN